MAMRAHHRPWPRNTFGPTGHILRSPSQYHDLTPEAGPT
jgi:hypothetical protein